MTWHHVTLGAIWCNIIRFVVKTISKIIVSSFLESARLWDWVEWRNNVFIMYYRFHFLCDSSPRFECTNESECQWDYSLFSRARVTWVRSCDMRSWEQSRKSRVNREEMGKKSRENTRHHFLSLYFFWTIGHKRAISFHSCGNRLRSKRRRLRNFLIRHDLNLWSLKTPETLVTVAGLILKRTR
jgi:hypothetical protein